LRQVAAAIVATLSPLRGSAERLHGERGM